MTQFRISTQDGSRPADWLACLGMASLIEGSTLHFEKQVPVLTTHGSPEETIDALAEGLQALTHPDRLPWEPTKHEQSPTPLWRFLNDLADMSWTDPSCDALLRTASVGRAKREAGGKLPAKSAEWQAPSGALLFIGARMYLRNTLANLWATPPAADGFRSDFGSLLAGRPAAVAKAKGFFLTSTEDSPWTRGGGDEAWLLIVQELLGVVGICRLLPDQLSSTPRGARPSRGLTWCLNPTPLTADVVAQLHETGKSPSGWPRWTAGIEPILGSPYFTHFTDVTLVENQ